MKKALITGVYGQDGSYLAELLTAKNYEVYGLRRKELSANSLKIKNYLQKIGVTPVEVVADLTDYVELKNTLREINPAEIYHLAVLHQSSEESTAENILYNKNICAASNLLAITSEFLKPAKVVLAGSCLMFDNSPMQRQTEKTLFNSGSLYGLEKIAENQLAQYYRAKGMFVCNAILYNHESSRRSDNFVTKKIVKNMIAIKKGQIKQFALGNLTAQKDWGYAKDYALGMWLMLQAKIAADYILATNKLATIADFIEICASHLELKEWRNFIQVDESIITRKIKTTLVGDYSKAKEDLGWDHSMDLNGLVELMLKNELNNELI
ncbi:MAG: GDP-mannose 4,6-dehydratase [Sporomusaceae bacterium]|jgi:GDPmannose 4,6-dehydratase|nr:GDP-mannose 4,6-dehydratase [Sporomusaceae bacterium]